jgi:hypothetical protein
LWVSDCDQSPCEAGSLPILPDKFEPYLGGKVFTTTLPFTTFGTPSEFPNDGYEIFSRVAVVGGSLTTPESLPLDAYVDPPSVDLSNVAVNVVPDSAIPTFGQLTQIDHNGRLLSLVALRSPLAVGYAYVIALVPLVFALAIGYVMSAHFVGKPMDMATLYAGLAAAALVILPLRAILIPIDIQGFSLTRIDLVLGLDLGVLTGLASLAFCRYLAEGEGRSRA